MRRFLFLDKKANDSAQLLKVLAEKNRIRILYIFLHRTICVCKLADGLKIPQNLLSHHLKVLYESGFLQKKREGNKFFYYIKKSKEKGIKKLFDFLSIS